MAIITPVHSANIYSLSSKKCQLPTSRLTGASLAGLELRPRNEEVAH